MQSVARPRHEELAFYTFDWFRSQRDKNGWETLTHMFLPPGFKDVFFFAVKKAKKRFYGIKTIVFPCPAAWVITDVGF